MLEVAEMLRTEVAASIPREHKSALGQFMTPLPVARFMASLFRPSATGALRLLDAGAGLGALSCAVLDRWEQGELGEGPAAVEAHELDSVMREHLMPTLRDYSTRRNVQVKIVSGDFIAQAPPAIFADKPHFTHAILNPPYKKMGATSEHRRLLRSLGIEAVNLYAAFVSLALLRLAPAGQLVAILPRSFCNGPYYRPFREFLFQNAVLRHIHLFDSRSHAFRDDEVLQENVIVLFERAGTQGGVRISVSEDDRFADLREHTRAFAEVVLPHDPQLFIHIPTEDGASTLANAPGAQATLKDLGITVSTGPVVDFRMSIHLRAMPDGHTVPLLYPVHFAGGGVRWPIDGQKKPNAIARNIETERWLYPAGHYTVVRRFSSKEEARRVVASVVEPADFGNPARFGFENHLNVFHEDKRGLPPSLARGLAVYLNAKVVDDHFRRFNGHTQVNATDLRSIRYPAREVLEALGNWAGANPSATPEAIDAQVEAILR